MKTDNLGRKEEALGVKPRDCDSVSCRASLARGRFPSRFAALTAKGGTDQLTIEEALDPDKTVRQIAVRQFVA